MAHSNCSYSFTSDPTRLFEAYEDCRRGEAGVQNDLTSLKMENPQPLTSWKAQLN